MAKTFSKSGKRPGGALAAATTVGDDRFPDLEKVFAIYLSQYGLRILLMCTTHRSRAPPPLFFSIYAVRQTDRSPFLVVLIPHFTTIGRSALKKKSMVNMG